LFIPDPESRIQESKRHWISDAGSGSATFMMCRVSMSSVFPGREKDWVEFGTFLYEDERTIQTFKNEEGILGKYIKVSLVKKKCKGVAKFSRYKVSFFAKIISQ
jgi:hypothetical protein